MSISSLAKILDDTRTKLDKKGIKLPVATSDLGDDWTSELASDSDYIMANIHPFFAGVTAEEAADWTSSFWKNNNGQFWPAGKFQSPGGKVEFTIHAAPADWFQSLTGWDAKAYIGEIVATKAEPHQTVPLSKACGKWIDWYEGEEAP